MGTFLGLDFLLLVLLALPLQGGVDSGDAKREMHPGKGDRKQELAQLSLRDLSKRQKQHLRSYLLINEAFLRKRFDMKKVYEAQFAPVAQEAAQTKDLLMRIVDRCQQQAEKTMEQGNETEAMRRNAIAEHYRNLAEAALRIEKAFPAGSFDKMNSLMDKYVDLEIQLRRHKLKPPQRGWLTSQEADRLILEWYRLKKSKQKQRR